jgi:hypothetical protein
MQAAKRYRSKTGSCWLQTSGYTWMCSCSCFSCSCCSRRLCCRYWKSQATGRVSNASVKYSHSLTVPMSWSKQSQRHSAYVFVNVITATQFLCICQSSHRYTVPMSLSKNSQLHSAYVFVSEVTATQCLCICQSSHSYTVPMYLSKMSQLHSAYVFVSNASVKYSHSLTVPMSWSK